MKYALIGCGRISPNHLKAAINNNLNIVAICDIEKERMAEKAEMFKAELIGAKHYTDYLEMLEKEKPELVAIATESGKHAQIAIDCLNNGANLIIEKPLALSLKDADMIIKLSDEKGLKVSACHQNRFNKAIQKMRQSIEKEDFGKLFYGTAHIRWNRGEEYYKQAPWRGTWEQDGGALMNQCIHNIDLLRWMMGDEIDQVSAFTDNLNHDFIDAEDLGIAIVKFKNGSFGIIEGTTNVYPKNLEETLYLFGEKGTAKAGGSSVNNIEVWKFENGEDEGQVISEFNEVHENVYGLGHTPLYADVIDSIKNNRLPYIDAYAGKRALELVLAIYKSSKEGKSIKFPVENISTMDFKDMF